MARPETPADSLADWLIGGSPKKRALLELLLRERPQWTLKPWSETELCRHTDATAGGLDQHLGRLVAMGYLEAIPGRPRRWRRRSDEELSAGQLEVRERLAALFEAIER